MGNCCLSSLPNTRHLISAHRRSRASADGSLAANKAARLVEMALVMPVMLMMLTGIFSFSVVLYQKLQLAEAVSNAGRVMALERDDTDPCATTAAALYAAAPALAQSNLTLTFITWRHEHRRHHHRRHTLRRNERHCSDMHSRRQRRVRNYNIAIGLARTDSGYVSVHLHYLQQ